MCNPNTSMVLPRDRLNVSLYRITRNKDFDHNAVLRSKFSHTLSLLFLCTSQTQWTSFFNDLFPLIRTTGSSNIEPSSSSSINLNTHISILFFQIVLEISGEISDQLLKSARMYHPERHSRDTRVRDLVRERDARGLNDAVVGIVTECLHYVKTLRGNGGLGKEIERFEEVVYWGIKSFASYIREWPFDRVKSFNILSL
jgi:exportin-T